MYIPTESARSPWQSLSDHVSSTPNCPGEIVGRIFAELNGRGERIQTPNLSNVLDNAQSDDSLSIEQHIYGSPAL